MCLTSSVLHGAQARSNQTYDDGRHLANGATQAGNDESFAKAEGCKRRRGRPVGSKDRQPRVKRMATSPQPSTQDDKGSGTCDGESGRRKPWKIILTAEQAVEIYQKRSMATDSQATSSCRSNEIAELYGVNSKTIRDIWNRATWVKATRSVWTAEEEAQYMSTQLNSSGCSPNGTRHELDASQAVRCSDEVQPAAPPDQTRISLDGCKAVPACLPASSSDALQHAGRL